MYNNQSQNEINIDDDTNDAWRVHFKFVQVVVSRVLLTLM